MRVGDKLYCYNHLISTINGGVHVNTDFTIGNYYSVFNINGSFSSEDIKDNMLYYVWVSNDKGICEWFSSLNDHIWYIGNNFYTISEIRSIKLDRLKNMYTV